MLNLEVEKSFFCMKVRCGKLFLCQLTFNMSDVARSRGMEFDLERFEKLLNVSIVPTIGHRSKGLKQLMETAMEAVGLNGEHRPTQVKYDQTIVLIVKLKGLKPVCFLIRLKDLT